MPFVKFFSDEETLDHHFKVVQRFRAGEVVELSDASARHWVDRNLAEFIQGKPKKRGRPRKTTKKQAQEVAAKMGAKADAKGRPTKGDSGPSQNSGPEKPSSASAGAPALPKKTLSMSDVLERPEDVVSLSSTEAGKSSGKPMSSTGPIAPGGEQPSPDSTSTE